MPTNFIEELKWRGMIHDIMPGTEEALLKQVSAGYIGFDPTADSLHVGHLVQIMTLVHFQRAGHKPYALVGGATGMVGDPSGKSQERNLLDAETLQHNVACVKKQLEAFLDFNSGSNAAEMVNNYNWFEKKRLETGMSFTEFSYQLVQGYDFYYLNQHHNCILQLGGSDQWGNIVTGTELIRRKAGGEAYAVTTPLIKKADGTKFGKTESGSVWLDPEKTSPYAFYQFWLNASDTDSANYIRIFTLKSKDEIEALEAQHAEAPHLRVLQKAIAEDITTRVHGAAALQTAIAASNILFGKSTAEDLRSLSEKDFYAVFEGVPQASVSISDFQSGLSIVEALAAKTGFLSSNGEARRELKANAVSVNKEKVAEDYILSTQDLINDRYVLLGKGKKNNYILRVE
jgi:tyrosyl-tRNA synthetase